MIFPRELRQKLKQALKICLMLDYDGTLADFAPTPDDVIPDPALIALLEKLSEHPKLDLAIVSGRRLAHVEKLVPLSDVWLAGSYGLEMRTPEGEHVYRSDYERLRPALDRLKPKWQKLLEDQEGFYLEDKGWSLALHARWVDNALAMQILNQARALAEQTCTEAKFQVLGGHKFLELAPKEADKGNTVTFILQNSASKSIFPIYLGDDDKDERAFPIVQAMGGLAGCVCHHPRRTVADFQLQSPQDTRDWLKELNDVIWQQGEPVTSDR